MIGEDVGFYFTGNHARLIATKETTIDLKAPLKGRMAGILFFESRSQKQDMDHYISSNNARQLVGTIYFPVSTLKVDATGAVADKSAYTAIVARRIHSFYSANVVLNSDYGSTNVPVPDGIKGDASMLRLVE